MAAGDTSIIDSLSNPWLPSSAQHAVAAREPEMARATTGVARPSVQGEVWPWCGAIC